jgi:uracil-DNA glycosylase family 4
VADRRDKIRNPDCELCPLHEGAEHVCLMGAGSTKADIMIVGEAPGAREDEQHQAFVGKAGKLLDRYLKEHAKLKRSDCYITNVAKCRPPENRTPERSEIKICTQEYLVQEIEMVKPKWVMLLGNSALQGVIGRSGITKHRGARYDLGEFVAMATFHPAAVLRNPRYAEAVEADLARFGRMIRGEETSPDTKVQIVRNARQLAWLLRQLADAKDVTIDIETEGEGDNFAQWLPGARIVSIAFTWKEGQAAFVPLHHSQTPWKDPQAVLDHLAPYLDNDAKHNGHNFKFDARWCAHFGAPIRQTFCTMLAAHMLDENRMKGLKPLSQFLLGADAYDLGDELKSASKVPLKKLAVYNGKDTDYTHRLRRVFKAELKEQPRVARVFVKLMMPASNAMVEVERRGIYVDRKRLDERRKEVERKCARLEQAMLTKVPEHKREEFNFNSSPQVSEWLFTDLGMPVLERTKKNMASSKESVLLQLQKDHKIVAALLKWRMWNKYRTTYFNPWTEKTAVDSRIRPTYKLFGTVTGRLSCVEPNLQQVPRNVFARGVFGAAPGHVFVEADYSQIELRIAAMLANERRMLRIFAAGKDMHLNTAAEVTGKRPEDIAKEERKKAKAVNFGFLYGMGHKKFVLYARDNYDVEVTEAEAEKVRKRFFTSYPGLRPWHDRQRRLVNRYERVHSPIGRVRHLPDIRSGDKDVRAEAERQAINSPVQSFASDMTLMAMVLLTEKGIPVVGLVHDALLFEIPKKKLKSTLPVIQETMLDLPLKQWFGTELTVPIEVEISVGTHWSEGEVWNGN